MDGYTVLYGVLIFFGFFIYATWFGTTIKIESQKNESPSIKINPYDNVPFSRKFIDKKNKQIGIFDLGNHILIIGMVMLVIFVSINAD
jgi:TRAP-type C4-dicarboxylate transport system permease small subunit